MVRQGAVQRQKIHGFTVVLVVQQMYRGIDVFASGQKHQNIAPIFGFVDGEDRVHAGSHVVPTGCIQVQNVYRKLPSLHGENARRIQHRIFGVIGFKELPQRFCIERG